MKKNLQAIKSQVNNKQILNELEIIFNLFKAYKNKTFNLQKVMDMTGIDENTIFETISVSDCPHDRFTKTLHINSRKKEELKKKLENN